MINKTYLLCCYSFLFLAGSVFGQGTYQKAIHFSDSGKLNFQILYPENFNPEEKYPVLLFLHGAGERGDDNEKQMVHGSKLFLDSSFRKKYPSVVIFPQCPKDDYWSNAELDRAPDGIGLWFKNLGEPTQAMALLVSMMDSIASLSYFKDNQIYVGGLSMGGMGTFEILAWRPDMFAAAFPICGGGSSESAATYAKKVKLWVFHGAKDDVVFPSFSTNMVIALKEAEGDVKYTLFKDANHNSWDPAFAEPNLFPWLFSITKNNVK